MPEEMVPIKIEIKNKLPNVVIKRTARNAHTGPSPTIAPGSMVDISICQEPSIKPKPSAPGSSELVIPKINIIAPKLNTKNKEKMASHLITPIGPEAIVFSK